MMSKFLASLFLSLLLIPLAHADFIPPEAPEGYVLDEAEILLETTKTSLETQLQTLDQETSTQIVVVTLPDLQGYTIEEAGLTIGRTWGVGQEEFNNGVVFLIAPNDRTARIEVGYGLEGAITDAQSNAILQESINYFMSSGYDAGIQEGINYLEILARGEEFPLEEITLNMDYTISDYIAMAFPILMSFFFFLVPLIWALLSWLSGSKAWWIGGVIGGVAGIILTFSIWGLLTGASLGLLLDYCLSTFLYKKIKMPKGSTGIGGSSRSGRSSGGSSFGGFGGGGFGGGGSTGRW